MATYRAISGTVPQYSTEDNELASGYWLKFYDADTTTPRSMATDATAGTLLAKCKLNTRGMPITNENDDDTVFIPHMDANYRIVLYKTEADADANTTVNAEFNIPNIAPEIAPSADAADILLRTNSLEAWDDYDRSPLFVDGTDFTAGAGPHTITVPSGWDPTGTMRFWRLDASTSLVEALTPTSTTSSSFTVAETLLSSDVLFIGDEAFRNIHDGDPADIRNRLSVPSNDEALLVANYLQEIKDAGAAAQAAAAGNIGAAIYSETGPLLLDGEFDGGSIFCAKIGNVVTITSFDNISMTSALSTPDSNAGLIPEEYRPSEITRVVSEFNSNYAVSVKIYTDGRFGLEFNDSDTGAAESLSTGPKGVTITYIITGDVT